MGKSHQILLFLVVVILTASVCGCLSAPSPVASPIETPTSISTTIATPFPTTTPLPTTTRPQTCSMQADGSRLCLFTDLTTIPTTAASKGPAANPASSATAEVQEIYNAPMAAPITLTGVGNQIVRFETVAPGTVQFKMRNGYGSQTVKNCEEKYFSVMLAGSSVDMPIYDQGMALSIVTRTANIINPGPYSLSVKSCGQWEIKIDNA